MRHPLFAFDPAPVTIIGIGSPFGDDRVGWSVADALAERLSASEARVLKLDRPGTALLDEVAGRHRAVLVDAAATGAAAGTLHCIALEDLPATSAGSSHGLGLADALQLGRSLGVLPAHLCLYLVSIDPDNARLPGADLTPAVAAAVEPLAAAICKRLVACAA
jgi:hydrogenase maturation protease